jgi:hydrocephalus-inducing protein
MNGEKLEVPVIFTPREIRKYSETISFDFNNLYKIDVVISGEGIPMLLEL